jgi:uncharacterized repeat protein (TIGR02543 family)
MKAFYNCFILLVVFLMSSVSLLAQRQVGLGSASEVADTYKARARAAEVSGQETKIRHVVPGQDPLVLNVKVTKREGAADVYIGEVENKKHSDFFLKVSAKEMSGYIVLKDEKKAYQYATTAAGQAFLQEVDIDKVVCVEYQEGPAQQSAPTGQATTTGAAVPNLQSLPGASAVVLLDFDGQYVSGTYWNNGKPIDAAPSTLSSAEMEEVWKMISEDFRPFAVNITTSESVYLSAPATRRTRVIFTPTDFFYPGVGGVAYIGSFTWGDDTPCWVFNTSAKYAGEAGSHEIGHTMSLSHDGRTSPEEAYYYGQSSWSPIMGAGYFTDVVQWSKGEYLNANNLEDDLSILSTRNGFGYRADDHGNTISSATPLGTDNTGKITAGSNNGVITTQSDIDIFSFTTGGGAVSLTVSPSESHPNLDIKLTLLNSSNSTVASSDPSGLSATINKTLAAGTYYVHVNGVKGAMGADSDYGSLGGYTLSGTVPPATTTAGTLRLTSGGTQFTDGQSRVWAADTHFSGGTTSAKSFDVAGTTDDELYLKYRFAASKAPFSYSIPLGGSGTYRVRLHFLEPYFGAPGGGAGSAGKRVFHVDVEGKRVLSNYDIYAQDGAGRAVVKTFENVSVTDGTLNLLLTSVVDNAIISAIEVEKVTTYTLTTSATGSGTVTRSPNQTSYASGTIVKLTATPSSGYTFTGWSGSASGTTNPLSVTMSSNKTITANFAPTSAASTLRLTSGGTQFTDGQSRVWAADTHFSGGTTSAKSFDVAGTTDDELYLKYRFAASKAPFSYSIPLGGSGTYRVRLHFLEPYFGAPGGGAGSAGKRVFHVDVEGKRVLSNYDIYAQDGAGRAVVKTFENVSVTDGTLNLLLTSVVDNAIISAIEVERISTSASPVAAASDKDPQVGQAVAQVQSFIASPSPFSDRVSLRFTFEQTQPMDLRVYDSQGKEVASIYKGEAQGGKLYEFEWQPGVNQVTGLYILRLHTPTNTSHQKVIFMRN